MAVIDYYQTDRLTGAGEATCDVTLSTLAPLEAAILEADLVRL